MRLHLCQGALDVLLRDHVEDVVLSSVTAVVPLDLGHDLDPDVVFSRPGMTIQSTDGCPALIGPSIRVDHITGHLTSPHLTSPDDSVAKRDHGQAGLHPCVNGIRRDPVGVDILVYAGVKLDFIVLLVRDVADPQLVCAMGIEHVPDRAVLVEVDTSVVVNRWPGLLAVLATLFTRRRLPAVVRTDPLCSPR